MIDLPAIWKDYKIPILLGSLSILCIGTAFILTVKSVQVTTPIQFSSDTHSATVAAYQFQGIMVDISGGVKNPGVFSLPVGSRVEDAIELAGGFSHDADPIRIATIINRAAKLSDGAKLYIPVRGDTESTTVSVSSEVQSDMPAAAGVSINSASQSELESLSGIGPATASKIIHNRPYTSLEQLVEKKSIGNTLFQKLKSKLTL